MVIDQYRTYRWSQNVCVCACVCACARVSVRLLEYLFVSCFSCRPQFSKPLKSWQIFPRTPTQTLEFDRGAHGSRPIPPPTHRHRLWYMLRVSLTAVGAWSLSSCEVNKKLSARNRAFFLYLSPHPGRWNVFFVKCSCFSPPLCVFLFYSLSIFVWLVCCHPASLFSHKQQQQIQKVPQKSASGTVGINNNSGLFFRTAEAGIMHTHVRTEAKEC